MDQKNHTIELFATQSKVVQSVIEQEGVAYCKRIYVEKKYSPQELPVFLTVYDWMAKEMAKRLPKPPEAELPYWLYENAYSATSEAGDFLKLRLPRQEAVFFDVYNWNKLLSLSYLAEDAADEKQWKQQMADYGVRREMDIMLTSFYPDLKRQMLNSWQRLFRHHEDIKNGHPHGAQSVQAAAWCLKKDWLIV